MLEWPQGLWTNVLSPAISSNQDRRGGCRAKCASVPACSSVTLSRQDIGNPAASSKAADMALRSVPPVGDESRPAAFAVSDCRWYHPHTGAVAFQLAINLRDASHDPAIDFVSFSASIPVLSAYGVASHEEVARLLVEHIHLLLDTLCSGTARQNRSGRDRLRCIRPIYKFHA